MTSALLFSPNAAQVEEHDGFFHLTFTSGDHSATYVLTAHSLLRHIIACNRASDGFYERKRGGVVPFASKRKQ